MFDQWPQAISTDEGDLRVLHDMANMGAEKWREKLRWPAQSTGRHNFSGTTRQAQAPQLSPADH
jgi:hypothetical protein